MRTIDIGIGHDNNLVIPQFANIIIIGANTRSKGRNHRFNFFILQHFIKTCFLHVQYLAAQGQNGLILPVPTLLGRAAGGITFHQIYFTQCRIFFLTIGKFARQCANF